MSQGSQGLSLGLAGAIMCSWGSDMRKNMVVGTLHELKAVAECSFCWFFGKLPWAARGSRRVV